MMFVRRRGATLQQVEDAIASGEIEIPGGSGATALADLTDYPEGVQDLIDASGANLLGWTSVVAHGAVEGSAANATTAFEDAITAALAAAQGALGIAVVYVPEGDWYIDSIEVVNQVLFVGAGSGITRIFHRAGNAAPLFTVTGDDVAPDATPYSGFTNLSLLGNTNTTPAILYYEGNIDNQCKFDDLMIAFPTGNANTACDGFSVQDYLNWHLTHCRFDAIPGWALRVRGPVSTDFQGSGVTVRDFTWDAGASGNAKGLFLGDYTNVSDNHRGSVVFDGGTIEVNGALNVAVPQKAVIRVLQNTTWWDAKGPQIDLVLRSVHAKVNSGSDAIKNTKLISTDYKDLNLIIDDLTVNQFAEVYNNDSGDARHPILGRRSEVTYIPFYRTAIDPNWEVTRRSKAVLAGLNVSTHKTTTQFSGGVTGSGHFAQPGDISYRRAPDGTDGRRTFAAMAVHQNEGQSWNQASNFTTGSITSGQATLTLAAVTSDFVNPGNSITVAGAGAASGVLTAKIKSIDYSTKVATLDTNAGTTVSGANVSPAIADFRYVEMCGYGTTAPASGAWQKGDWVKNTDPAAGEPWGWVCTASGSPGTWVPFGMIASEASAESATLNFVIDGGGSAITTGVKGDVQVPYACTVTGWDIVADQSGSIVVDVWKDSYTNFPPVVGDSIAGSEKPTLSSATKNQDTSLTTWTTGLAANDWLRFNVDSASTVTRVTVSLRVTRTGA